MGKLKILFLVILLVMPLALAKQGHMKLLAVKEGVDGYEGASADLYLEIKPGKGRVFLETYPLLKIDTQISTRFAKDIACDYLDIDCSGYDFVYTINSDSVIIGGPSAGAAITTLTIALLDGFEINEKITITGTINSGGIVGSVGGIKEKIEAAEDMGMDIVLIPQGERFVKEDVPLEGNDTYITIDLYEHGEKHNIQVKEVSNLDDILYVFTGKEPENGVEEIVVDKGYEQTMGDLAVELCNRSNKLRVRVDLIDNYDNTTFFSAVNLTSLGEEAFSDQRYYSAASYCFGANVRLSHIIVLSQNLSYQEIKGKANIIKENIKEFNKVIDRKKTKTITDLEAFMIVKERLTEAMDEISIVIENNQTDDTLQTLAYASERVYSAYSWFKFFDNRGGQILFNKENLKKSCQNKIEEAEERYQYAAYFLPITRKDTKKEIALAYEDLENGDYELCLFKASKSKAESDVILSLLYIEEDNIDMVINQKLDIAKKIIAKQMEKGVFPILGYSYYEYAQSLNESDKYSTLLYSEYALELSNLDLYFKERRKVYHYYPSKEIIIAFAIGGIVGSGITFLLRKRTKNKRPKKSKSRLRNPSRTQKRALLGKKR